MLVDETHHVAAMTLEPEESRGLEAMGAEPVLGDVFDLARLMKWLSARRTGNPGAGLARGAELGARTRHARCSRTRRQPRSIYSLPFAARRTG